MGSVSPARPEHVMAPLTSGSARGIMTIIEQVRCPKAVMETSKRGSVAQESPGRCDPGAQPSPKIPPELLTEKLQAE
jgi:hypothetical protein